MFKTKRRKWTDIEKDFLQVLYCIYGLSIKEVGMFINKPLNGINKQVKTLKYKHTKEQTFRIKSDNTKAKNNPMYGKSAWCKDLTKQTNNIIKEKSVKLSKTRKEMYKKGLLDRPIGAKNPWWNGGNHNPCYPERWKTIREEVRERDNRTCQLCGKSETDNGKKLDVHHIDYNKKNLDKRNLISLCKNCHPMTNVNREFWKEWFYKYSESCYSYFYNKKEDYLDGKIKKNI